MDATDTSAAVHEEQHPEVLELTAESNPYLDFYNEFCDTRQHELISVFDPAVKEKTRAKMYASLDVSVAMKYSWAIPDERALRIIKHYGPIVEMGAGNGYWGKLLQLRGVDIICYDLHVANDDDEEASAAEGGNKANSDGDEVEDEEGKEQQESDENEDDGEKFEAQDAGEEEEREVSHEGEDEEENENNSEYEEEDEDEEVEVEQIYWTDVLKGTPKDLRKHSDRTLFLCYPDDFEDSEESMALQCLYNYTGDTIVHVGELFGQSLCLPGAWGRTSAKEFQEHLASVYHKVLQVPLPSWHSSVDTLTVWKRTKTSMMGSAVYAFIPSEERLDLIEACPSTRHLLHLTDDAGVAAANGESEKKPSSVTPEASATKINHKRQKRNVRRAYEERRVNMKSPKRSALAYVAEYQFGDDNLLTATFQEEERLRNEVRVRNAQPAIRLRDILLSDDNPVINNAKRLQQNQGKPLYRRDVIEQHNMLLLERLEKIHQQHVPRQFDVSHLSEEVLNAPRATNASQRRKQQKQIERENEKLQTRLLQARSGTLSNKKLAMDADKHQYLAEQISKAARRRKVRERCQALSDQQYATVAQAAPVATMAAHTRLQLFNEESCLQLYERNEHEDESYEAHGMMGMSGSKSLSRLDRHKKPGSFAKLPQIHHQQHHYDQYEHRQKATGKVAVSKSLPAACSPTLTHTTKLISALDLPGHAFRNNAK